MGRPRSQHSDLRDGEETQEHEGTGALSYEWPMARAVP